SPENPRLHDRAVAPMGSPTPHHSTAPGRLPGSVLGGACRRRRGHVLPIVEDTPAPDAGLTASEGTTKALLGDRAVVTPLTGRRHSGRGRAPIPVEKARVGPDTCGLGQPVEGRQQGSQIGRL